MNNRKTIRIVRPSSQEEGDLLSQNIPMLEQAGFQVLYEPSPKGSSWPYTAGTIEVRQTALNNALTEKDSDIVLCARGGYGMADLLAGIPWEQLKRLPKKMIVGFSDISALHAAVYTQLGWPCIHGPMPATKLWGQNSNDDIDHLIELMLGERNEGAIQLSEHMNEEALSGKIFGGCLSVLSALIGTPFFPKSLDEHILFLEDTSESPGRLMRHLQQWHLSGHLAGVKGIIWGHLRDCVSDEHLEDWVLEQTRLRFSIPTMHSDRFGHTSPNFPLPLGATGEISGNHLTWRFHAP